MRVHRRLTKFALWVQRSIWAKRQIKFGSYCLRVPKSVQMNIFMIYLILDIGGLFKMDCSGGDITRHYNSRRLTAETVNDNERRWKVSALLRTEYRYCSVHKNQILQKASAVYRIGCNANHRLNHLCCNFKSLEEAAQIYISQ